MTPFSITRKLIVNQTLRYFLRYYSSDKIVIPARIHRKPTDILKVLASTIKVDTTGPGYKYHDDPFLTPISNLEKKRFALSKESGRKAARWIKDTNPNIFSHQPDDPIIPEFLPKIKYEEKDVNEDLLINSIKNCSVSETIELYTIFQDNNIELSDETLQSMLELVSYYNAEDTIDPYWEEEIYTENIFKNQRLVKTWKDGGVADGIFQKIKHLGSKPYCTVIRGMCKYFQTERAWQLYQEALNKNLNLDIETYNSLFRVSLSQSDESEERWNFITNLLQNIKDQKLSPNLRTLNSILECLSIMRTWNKATSISLQIFKEFQLLKIQPSLTSYTYLIRIHQSSRNKNSSIIESILQEIEGKTFEIADEKDTWFFFIAMESCKNWELAQRLHRILFTGDNYKFLSQSVSESLYYKNFILQAVNGLNIDEFMKIYDEYVPYVFSPDTEIIEEILKSMGFYNKMDDVPRIWSDIIYMGLTRNERVLELILMIINKHNLENVEATLASRLATVAWDIWERVEQDRVDSKIRRQVEWSGHMLGDCISILVRCGELDKGFTILKSISNDPSTVLGIIPVETLKILFDSLLKNEQNESCMVVAKYAKDSEYSEAFDMAKKLSKQSNVTQQLISKITYSFGTDVL